MLGTVSTLWRYPVKSMRGEQPDAIELVARGVAGDRLFAIRDADGKFGSGKSTRRFRHIAGLFAFTATYRDGVPEIRFPDGRLMRGDDPTIHAALSAALGQPVTLAREAEISHLDAAPLHLVTTASLRWLSAALPDASIDERRFRPNFVVNVPGATPVEQRWLGATLRVGDEVVLRVFDSTERCAMVGFAQSELANDPQILRHIAATADVQFGVYAEVITPGRIRRGDPVTVGDTSPVPPSSL